MPPRSRLLGACTLKIARRPGIRDFAERSVMEYPTHSFRLDVRCPYYFAPLLGFVGDEPAEVAGREREHVPTEVGKPCLDLGISKAGVDLLV